MFGDSAFSFGQCDQGLGEMLVGRAVKPDPVTENGSNNDDEFGSVLNYGSVNGLSDGALPISFASVTESFKKRKADETQNLKVNSEENYRDKKMKEVAEDERSKITEQNINGKNNKSTTKKKGPSADNSKGSDGPKTDYIHVRARRGQATDSHSLAERVRREKISERMRYLQDLVPGCNQIIGKAGMLDEIINYVQSLQTQVEFLSMKLSTVNPGLDFDPEKYLLSKEMFPARRYVPDNISPTHFPFVTIGQGISHSDFEMGIKPRNTINAHAPIPVDSSCLNQFHHLPWDAELQNLYSMEFQQGRSPLFTTQPITDCTEAGHVKLEK